MAIHSDFRELLASFNANGVEYLVVGGYALAHHGAPRSTGDLDLFVKPDAANAERILTALNAFGFDRLDLSADDFTTPDRIVQLGVPPVRVDIITGIDGVSWDQAWAGRAQGDYDGVHVNVIGRKQLIDNKRASGRRVDAGDIERLGET